MKTKLALLLLAPCFLLLLSGCNVLNFEATKPDGTVVKVRSVRAVWSTDEYAAQIGTNSASLTAKKSTVDATAIEATAAGVARGLTPKP